MDFNWVNVGQVLSEEHIGFEEIGVGIWDVYYGPLWLGRFYEKLMKIKDHQGKFERVSERTDFRILAFGIAIKNNDDLIIPECSYYKSPFGDEFFSIGIGLRASLNRSKKTE